MFYTKSIIGWQWQLSSSRSCEVTQAGMFTSRVLTADRDTRHSEPRAAAIWPFKKKFLLIFMNECRVF